ncbi:cytokine receptor family member B12 [Scleropages formosus]|uniref:Interferon alpha/beta receptor 2-like n=1 Tax=Scleropages formosus TaxID=113540 RepID=A0A8C9SWG8_SCLFO|nr:interferon alpha/beta receptor 2-like [Scleropages formosus]
MTWLPLACCILMLFFLLASAGKLLPPTNLTVTLLDFEMNVSWIPQRENPHDTKYSVEIQEAGQSNWTTLKNCRQLSGWNCSFSFPLEFNELIKNYFVRVKAFHGGEISIADYKKSIQPYGGSLLSGPDLTVSVQKESVKVLIHHQLEPVLQNLSYSLNLTQRTPGNDLLISMVNAAVSPWTFPREQLRPGHLYCVSAAVNHRQQQQQHLASERCVFLRKTSRVEVIVRMILGTLVPLSVLTLLILVALFFYLKPRNDEADMPTVLNEVSRTTTRTMVVPTEWTVQPEMFSLEPISRTPRSCPGTTCQYASREVVPNPNRDNALPAPAAEGEGDAGLEFQGSKYHEVNDEEWSRSSVEMDSAEDIPSIGLSDGDGTSHVASSSEDDPYYRIHTDSESLEDMTEEGVTNSSEYNTMPETDNLESYLTHLSGYESRPDPCFSNNDLPPK